MKSLLSNQLIVSFIRYVTENATIDPDELNEQYAAFTEHLQTIVNEKCPIIQILRQLAVATIELRTLQGNFDKVKKKCALPHLSG